METDADAEAVQAGTGPMCPVSEALDSNSTSGSSAEIFWGRRREKMGKEYGAGGAGLGGAGTALVKIPAGY